ncbi:MAG TPA: TolC family protein [Verrucomicrobiae bacterium]
MWSQTETASPGATAPEMPARRMLTLADAKRQAFERNWDLLAAQSDVDIATAQKIVAREFPNPTLSFSTAQISVDNHAASTPAGNDLWQRSYDTIVAVNQLFEIGGKRSNRRASAVAGLKAAEARLMDARRTLDLAVTKSYVAALLAETNFLILRQSSASLRKEAKIAEARLNAGDISRADKSQIEIAAERLEMDAAAAVAAAKNARISVEVLLGVNKPTGDWAPGDSLDSLAIPPSLATERTSGAFLFPPARPDLLAAEAVRQKAEADYKYQKALRIPDPTLLVQYEHEPPDMPNTIGIGVSFPLPLWNHNRGNIHAADIARQQADLQLAKTKANIIAEIATAETTYADASARFTHQRDFIQPKSEDVRKTISFAYEKGGASLLDLLLAERNDNDVRLATAQAAAEAANAAAALKAATYVSERENSKPNVRK